MRHNFAPVKLAWRKKEEQIKCRILSLHHHNSKTRRHTQQAREEKKKDTIMSTHADAVNLARRLSSGAENDLLQENMYGTFFGWVENHGEFHFSRLVSSGAIGMLLRGVVWSENNACICHLVVCQCLIVMYCGEYWPLKRFRWMKTLAPLMGWILVVSDRFGWYLCMFRLNSFDFVAHNGIDACLWFILETWDQVGGIIDSL